MTESSTVTTTWQSLARRTALITGIAGALALTLAVSLALSWRGTLPDPVASHWGADGHPDGFSTVTGFLAIPLALGVLLLVGAVAAILVWGKSAAVRRVNAGAGVWVTSVLALTLVSSLAIQRHLADATTAAQPVWLMAVIFIIPFVPAVAVAVLVPRDPPRPATAVPPEGVPRWELGGGERAVWFERTGGGTSAIILVVVT
ncbi:MAG: DUF1648 domain-containing protein, partial [Propionibacteriaceae bacterium]|nr:DUF1648 domain-containing protein [Propionibacteriaceae bacterium]